MHKNYFKTAINNKSFFENNYNKNHYKVIKRNKLNLANENVTIKTMKKVHYTQHYRMNQNFPN